MKKFLMLLAVPFALAVFACGTPSSSSGSGDPIKTQGGASGVVAENKDVPKVYSDPVPADFTLALTELKRACFGSAGCNVTFTVQLTKVSASMFNPKKTYKLTYAVGGAEDTYTNYMTIDGDQYSHNDEEFVSVKSKSTKLVPTITQILAT
jgi:hypothetical protein